MPSSNVQNKPPKPIVRRIKTVPGPPKPKKEFEDYNEHGEDIWSYGVINPADLSIWSMDNDSWAQAREKVIDWLERQVNYNRLLVYEKTSWYGMLYYFSDEWLAFQRGEADRVRAYRAADVYLLDDETQVKSSLEKRTVLFGRPGEDNHDQE